LNLRILLWTTRRSFVISLAVALSRGVRNPALFPLRPSPRLHRRVPRHPDHPHHLAHRLRHARPDSSWLRGQPVSCGVGGARPVLQAYVAEIIRAGIESVHESQRAAARSIGMTSRQTMWSVVLPQAFRRVTHPMLNSFISLQKDGALLSLSGVSEMLRRAQIIQGRTFNFTPYVAAAADLPVRHHPPHPVADWLMARQRGARAGR
jgi:polar amino acid transport system permease protein